jgi:MFS family permease
VIYVLMQGVFLALLSGLTMTAIAALYSAATGRPSPGTMSGAAGGAVVGALLGLLFAGYHSCLLGAAVGTLTGIAAAKLRTRGERARESAESLMFQAHARLTFARHTVRHLSSVGPLFANALVALDEVWDLYDQGSYCKCARRASRLLDRLTLLERSLDALRAAMQWNAARERDQEYAAAYGPFGAALLAESDTAAAPPDYSHLTPAA